MANIFKPIKNRHSKFKRGAQVPCLVLSPGEKAGILMNLRKEENLLTNKNENQKFLIVEPPAMEIDYQNKTSPCYVCDSEKGVTVKVSFKREQELLSLFCDPKMVSNVFDETFISKASGIKPDVKQLIGIGLIAFIFGGLTGLMF